jgi:hypothetical protein
LPETAKGAKEEYMKNWQIRHGFLIMFVAFAVIPARNACTAESSPASVWEFDATLYAWMADIGGQTESGSDIDIDFDDLFDNLEMAFMGAVGVHKDKWSFLTDVIYLDVEADDTIDGIYADVELKAWIVTPFASYSLIEGRLVEVDLLAGARYLYMKTDLRLGPYEDKESDDIWDGIVGVRGRVNLSEKWYLPYHLDIGTGESDVTWQALGGVGYKFSHIDVMAGYRYLKWDFDSGKAIDDMDISGPYAGLKIRF